MEFPFLLPCLKSYNILRPATEHPFSPMDKKYRKTALAEPSGFDHRVIKDRREDYSLNYFKKNGEERRSPIENRQG